MELEGGFRERRETLMLKEVVEMQGESFVPDI